MSDSQARAAAEPGSPSPDPQTDESSVWTIAMLVGFVALTLVRHATGLTLLVAPAGAFLCVYLVLEWPRLLWLPRGLLMAAIVATALSLARDGGGPIAFEGLDRACYFPVFLVSLGFLREAASTSPLVVRTGGLLIAQPPGRRYLALTVGGHLFGLLLNLGGLTLLLSMVQRGNTLEAAGGDPRIQGIRERRMTLAVLRGFTLMPFWSPLSITIVMILAAMPQLHWVDMAPYGLAVAVLFMAIGWLWDRLLYPRRPGAVLPSARPAGSTWLAARFISLVLLIAGLAQAFDLLLGVRFVTATMIIVPFFGLVWMWNQRLGSGLPALLALSGSVAQMAAATRRMAPTYRNEIAIFAASGLVGICAAFLIPASAVEALMDLFGGNVIVLSLSVLWFLVAVGATGFNPMITAALLAAGLARLPLDDGGTLRIGFALVGGWALSVGVSPFSSSNLVAGRVLGRSSAELGLRWNGSFVAMCVVLFSLAIAFLPF